MVHFSIMMVLHHSSYETVSPPLVQILTGAACGLLFITGENAQLTHS